MPTPLDELDRRIVGALLRNGRAPWRLIAKALGEPERSIARRGRRLLDSGLIRIVAHASPAVVDREVLSLRVTAVPAALAAVADALADMTEITSVWVLSSTNACNAEAVVPRGDVAALIARIGALDGVTAYRADPVLRYHRTAAGWNPDVLDADAQSMLGPVLEHTNLLAAPIRLEPTTTTLLDAMADDGRVTAEDLARRLGVTKVTVGTWLERALDGGQMHIRGVVSPALLGYPVELAVRLRPRLHEIDDVAAALSRLPIVRVCAIAGTSIACDLVGRDAREIEHGLLEISRAFPALPSIDLDVVATAVKRSGIRFVDETPVDRMPVDGPAE